ncbi:MAG: hypothetical protein PHT69_12690 [Bacteroidales bacterium]|nr:hypothetical protein [Bacteroidales bacterium]
MLRKTQFISHRLHPIPLTTQTQTLAVSGVIRPDINVGTHYPGGGG